eukprot:gene37904-12525_t
MKELLKEETKAQSRQQKEKKRKEQERRKKEEAARKLKAEEQLREKALQEERMLLDQPRAVAVLDGCRREVGRLTTKEEQGRAGASRAEHGARGELKNDELDERQEAKRAARMRERMRAEVLRLQLIRRNTIARSLRELTGEGTATADHTAGRATSIA